MISCWYGAMTSPEMRSSRRKGRDAADSAAHVASRSRSAMVRTTTPGKAVDGAILAKFRNIGQACTAANRFIVHRSVQGEFARRVTERVNGFTVGRGTEEGVQIGPLIDDRAVAKASQLVRDAVDRGAKVATGGNEVEGPGTFYEPTVVTDVQPGSDILREEIFGPVLAIVPSTPRTTPCASRTTPSTASSRTCSPRASPAVSA